MSNDSPGQRCVREWVEKWRGWISLLKAAAFTDLADQIDALVRRERAAAFTEAAALADIMHMTTPSNIASALRARAAEEADPHDHPPLPDAALCVCGHVRGIHTAAIQSDTDPGPCLMRSRLGRCGCSGYALAAEEEKG